MCIHRCLHRYIDNTYTDASSSLAQTCQSPVPQTVKALAVLSLVVTTPINSRYFGYFLDRSPTNNQIIKIGL